MTVHPVKKCRHDQRHHVSWQHVAFVLRRCTICNGHVGKVDLVHGRPALRLVA